MKEYVDMPYPYISKSKIKDLEYCPYNFYDERILGHKRKAKRSDAIEGTNLHMVFNSFYLQLRQDDVFKDEFTDPRTPTERHPFRRFIYDRCMNFVKPSQRGFGKYKNVLSNFAYIECERWLRLNTILYDQKKIFDCFKPMYVEKRLEYEPLHMFGTIDRIGVEVLPNKVIVPAIFDYKTGNVPTAIQRFDSNVGGMFDWSVRPDLMKEIHFYGLLYLSLVGWRLSEEAINFIENPEWWFVKKDGMSYKETLKYKSKYLTSLGKDYKLFKNGKMFKGGDIVVGFYFLNGSKGYRPIKKYGYPSHKGVLLSINKYRSVMHNKYFITHPKYVFNYIGCEKKNCDKYESCLEKVQASRSM